MTENIAEQLAKKQREIGIAEFFSRNRHLLGFDNPRKALLMAVKEACDNSLAYEMPLLLKKNGILKVVKIGEFIDEQIAQAPTEMEPLRGGQLERFPVQGRVEVLAFDPKTLKMNFQNVSTLFRHKVNSPIYRVTLTSGRYVDLTAYHSVFTLQKGKVIPISTAELREGLPLIVPKLRWPQSTFFNEINVVEELLRLDPALTARLNIYGINSLFTTTIIEKLREKIPKQKWYKINDFRKCNYLPLNLLRELPLDLNSLNNSKVGSSLSRHKIPAIIPLDHQFAELLGIYMAEGSMLSSLRRIHLSFGSHEQEMMLYFADLFEKVFKLKPKITKAHQSAYNLICNSSMLCFFFKHILSVGNSAKMKRIPPLVFNLRPEQQCSFLTAYLAGDGYPTAELFQILKNDRPLQDLSVQRITCATASFELFVGLQYLLSSLGIGYSCGRQKAQKRLVKGQVANFGESYTLYIYTQNNQNDLNYLPIKETIISTTEAKLRYAISRDNQTDVHYKTIQNVLPSGNLLLYQGLGLFLEGDLGVLTIKKIEAVPYDKEWVYDVSVPGYENFVAGVGAIICHNSLDACEEARIMPDINVEIIKLDEKKFRVIIEDNGPGIVKKQIPKIFAKLLYGSKFHKLSSTRGQQGLGISAAVLYSQLTTGKPATILSKTGHGQKAHLFKLKINTQTNNPDVIEDTEQDWNEKEHGVRIEVDLEGEYMKGRQSVDEYLKETAIVNPHATIIYTNPEAQQIIFPRATEELPAEVKEIQPHPYGVELGMLMKMLETTECRTLQQFLTTEFVRVGPGTAKEICQNAALLPNTKPKEVSRDMAEQLYKGIQKTKIIAPPTDCISPIGAELLEKGLRKEINAEFYTAVTRPPEVYRGNPFIIEVGCAYGGEQSAEETMRILRFANRVPLLYQQGACAIINAIQNTAWRTYGLQQSNGALPTGPATIVIHMSSVWVPFTSESKEAIAHYPEIIKEVKLALQECGRRLGMFVNKKRRIGDEFKKRSYIEKYIPHVADALKNIVGLPETKKKEMEEKLAEILEHTRGELEEIGIDNPDYDPELAKIGQEEEIIMEDEENTKEKKEEMKGEGKSKKGNEKQTKLR